MVYVPAGEFLMGSSDSDPFAVDDEKPQHRVYLDGYWIGRTDVTNAQFGKFIEAGGYSEREYWTDEGWQWKESEGITQPEYWNDPTWNEPDSPVVGVTWYEAAAYAKWAGARLPTEAEWEKAARGTDGRIWPWSNEFSGEKANTHESGINGTTPVDAYPDGASPYGCLDMAGNVWEWVADWYGTRYYADSPDSNPAGLAYGSFRVIRGGSWFMDRGYARCAFRGMAYPVVLDNDLGFRVAE
jgi:formylglycine-generating enzyme required for sulfatase activity